MVEDRYVWGSVELLGVAGRQGGRINANAKAQLLADILAIEAEAAVEPVGLDVERLTKALQVSTPPKRIEDYRPEEFFSEYATAVADEYARLSDG